jgi:IMP cyclohydrolase
MPPSDLDILKRMPYPGRVIVLGREAAGEHDVVVYAITGRSSSSQARRLVFDDQGTVRTEVTVAAELTRGDEKLLIYNCLRAFPGGLAISNGAQTDLIWEAASQLKPSQGTPSALETLQRAFHQPHLLSGIDLTCYEPDEPAFTPRISGCLTHDAALSIVRRGHNGAADREFFYVPLVAGRGKLLATYAGQNRDPLPAFSGPPLDVGLSGGTADEVCGDVYRSLGPEAGGEDFRVAVMSLFRRRDTQEMSVSIINRDREER